MSDQFAGPVLPSLRPCGRLDLVAIEGSLRAVQSFLVRDESDGVGAAHDPMDDRVVDNLVAAYAYVDSLVAEGVDALAMGRLRHLLEINTIVLCGTDPARRDSYAKHLEATERRFYEQPGGGIEDLVEWHARHRRDGVWDVAAGAGVRVMSKPQLFVEGNHRTAALIMSYLLLRADRPPFVLTPASAVDYFALSAELGGADKSAPAAFVPLAALTRRLAALISRHADARHLRAA